jgi:hypothetical protein
MRGIIELAAAAALVVSVAAQPHQHDHLHRHAKKHIHLGAPVEKRDDAVTVTSVVAGPTVVAYVLDGQEIDASSAVQGLKDGLFMVMGTSTPTSSSAKASSTSTSTSTSSTSSAGGAQFFEQKVSSSSSDAAATTTSTPVAAATTSTTSAAAQTTSVAAGIDVSFPSGKILCSAGVPTDYGAIKVSWSGYTGGWTGLQQVGSYTSGVAISSIVTPTSGGCESGMFCSYACPPGYQKTQWDPNSQGATGQSIGGLYCNSDGYLEVKRSSHPKICEAGAGGVYIQNKLSGTASVCRTDYPGTENMIVPLITESGGTYPLTNPDSTTYYTWQGSATTAQYYVNPLGLSGSDACVWTSSTNPKSAGNWAPINIGVGKDSAGMTYISIFANSPTSTATLDFNIEITGDVSASCWYKSGAYYGGGTGCTVCFDRPSPIFPRANIANRLRLAKPAVPLPLSSLRLAPEGTGLVFPRTEVLPPQSLIEPTPDFLSR